MGTAVNVFRGMGLTHEKNGVALSSHLKLELATMYFKRKLWNTMQLACKTRKKPSNSFGGQERSQYKLYPMVILYLALEG